MNISYRLGDLTEWHDSGMFVGVSAPPQHIAIECLEKHYADAKWPATGPYEWTTTVHLSTGESVVVRAKMRPQLSIERYIPAKVVLP